MKNKVTSILTVLIMVFAIFSNFNNAYAEEIKNPSIRGKSGIAVDFSSNEIILSKDADVKMYPASLTKLMTALILAETTERDKEFPFSKNALNTEAYAINKNLFKLRLNDTMTADNLMISMLLLSANDAAVVVAEGVAGSVDKFVERMNNKAIELGMKNTHFQNPVGFHHDNHYSTAKDLAVLLKAAYDNPWIREVMGLGSAVIRTKGQPIGEVKTTNDNLGTDGCIGGKTGFTPQAGRCLANIFERNGRVIGLIILKNGTSFSNKGIYPDMINFADQAYKAKKEVLIAADEPIEPIETTFKLFKWFGPERKTLIKLAPTGNIEGYKNSYSEKHKTIVKAPVPSLDVFNLKKGDKVADIALNVDGQELKAIAVSNSSTFDSIIIPHIMDYIIWGLGGFFLLLAVTLISLKLLRSKKSVQHDLRNKRQNKRRKITRYRSNKDL